MSTPIRAGLFLYWNPKTSPDDYTDAPGAFAPIGRIAEGGLTIDNQTEIVEFKGPEDGGATERRLYAEPRNFTPIITARLKALTAFEWSLIFGHDKVGSTGTVSVTPGQNPALNGYLRVRGYNHARNEVIDFTCFACAKSDPMELTNQQFSEVTIQFYVVQSDHNTGSLYGVTA